MLRALKQTGVERIPSFVPFLFFFSLYALSIVIAAPVDPTAKIGAAELARIKGTLTAILREEAMQKQEELIRRKRREEQQNRQGGQPYKQPHQNTLVSMAEPGVAYGHGFSQTYHLEENSKTEDDPVILNFQRAKRNIAADLYPPGAAAGLRRLDSLRSAGLETPEEPLVSERVERPTPGAYRKEGVAKKPRSHSRPRRSLSSPDAPVYSSDLLVDDALSSRIASEDLYDLFVDYFERPDITVRRKRSILPGPNGEPVMAAFPQAERVKHSVDELRQQQVSSSIVVPPGLDPSDPNNVLTHQDIRDVTRKTDLGQILSWLEALSQGREHDVTAALLVAKKKSHHSKQQHKSESRQEEGHQSRDQQTANPTPPDPLGPNQEGGNMVAARRLAAEQREQFQQSNSGSQAAWGRFQPQIISTRHHLTPTTPGTAAPTTAGPTTAAAATTIARKTTTTTRQLEPERVEGIKALQQGGQERRRHRGSGAKRHVKKKRRHGGQGVDLDESSSSSEDSATHESMERTRETRTRTKEHKNHDKSKQHKSHHNRAGGSQGGGARKRRGGAGRKRKDFSIENDYIEII